MFRVLPLIALLVFGACSKGAPAAAASAAPQATTTAASQAPAVKPVPAQLPEVVARVNGETITKAEFEKAIQTVEAQNGSSVPADQRDRVLRGILDQMIGYKLLIQEGQARKLPVSDAEIEARVGQIRSQFPTEEAFKQALAAQKVTEDTLKSDARSEMLVTNLLRAEIEQKVAVKPEQVTDFYQKNTDKFQQGERVRASHILISVPASADVEIGRAHV